MTFTDHGDKRMTEPCKAGFIGYDTVIERCDKPCPDGKRHEGKHTATVSNPDTGRKKRVAWEDIKRRMPTKRTDYEDEINTALVNSNYEVKP